MESHRSTFWGQKHKSAIWDRMAPHLHIKPSLFVCRRVQGSQIFKQNWIISIRSILIVILLIWVSSARGVKQVGGGSLGWSTIVYMSSGMFRGKESSNRIEISWLVQDLVNFVVLGSLQLWGGGRYLGGCLGHLGHAGCHHMHTHACKCMYRNCKWPPTWRHPCLSCLSCLTCMCVCTCMHVHAHACMCAWDTPLPIHTQAHPNHPSATPRGDPQNWLKFNNTWTNQDISIPFEDFEICGNFSPMDGCMIWWVGWCVGGLMGGIRSNH